LTVNRFIVGKLLVIVTVCGSKLLKMHVYLNILRSCLMMGLGCSFVEMEGSIIKEPQLVLS